MKDSPSFVSVAALLGDPARATMLNALMGGQALTASELAVHANITKQTASSHLSKLVDAGLLKVQAQGRHRYFQLAAPDVATLLESLMSVAQRTRTSKKLPGPRDPALRKARRCYDHLAGELAVEAYDVLVARGFMVLARQDEGYEMLALTEQGQTFFEALGIDTARFGQSNRPICRPCLDWSVRRHHLAGQLGKALLEYCYQQRWARPVKDSRVVRFSATGEEHFKKAFVFL